MSYLVDKLAGQQTRSYTYRDLSTLGRILDFIQRPSYTMMNILEEFQDPERREAKEIFAPLYKKRLPEEVKGRGYDLYEDTDMPEWLKHGLGLGTEIVADPTTWLSFGATTAGAKALRQAGKFSKLGRLGQAQAGARAAIGYKLPFMKHALPVVKGVPYFKAESKVLKALNPLLKYVSKSAYLDSLPEGVKAVREGAEALWGKQGKKMASGLGELATAHRAATERGWHPETLTRILETAKTATPKVMDTPQVPDVMETILKATGREIPDISRGQAVFDMAQELAPTLDPKVVQQVAAKYDAFTGLRQQFFDSADVLLSRYAPEEAEAIAQMWVRHIATDDGLKLFGKIAKNKKLGAKEAAMRDFLFGWVQTGEDVGKVMYPPVVAPAAGQKKLAAFSYDQLFRKMARGEGIYEINKAARDLGLKPLFQDDITKIAKTVMGDTLRVTKKGHYLKLLAKSAEDTGLATSNADEGLQKGWKLFAEKYPDVVKRTTGETKELLSKLYFDPAHLDEVAGVIRAYSDPKAIKQFLHYYDNVIGVWKAWTLGPFLPYHVRNDFSDIIWMNGLRGVRLDAYPLAMRVIEELGQRGDYPPEILAMFKKSGMATPLSPFAGGATFFGKIKQALGLGADVSDDTIKQWADRIQGMDLLHKGQHVSETAHFTARGMATKPIRKMVDAGGVREDFGRIAHAIHDFLEGWADNEVFADVMKYHYNYGIDALTPFERFLPNRLFFFYRWSRMNIPGSIRNLFEHYGKHTAAAKMLRTIEESAAGGGYEKYMPEWMRERGPIQVPDWVPLIGGKKGEPKYFMTSAWWPFAEMAEFARLGKVWEPTEAMRPIVERLSPAAKIPIELGTGEELYYKKPIKLYPGQRRELLGVDMPAELGYLARQWRGVTEAERLKRRLARTEGPRATLDEILRSVFLGAKSYTFDPEREAGQRFFETIKQMGILKSELRRAEEQGRDETYDYLQALLDKMTGKAEEYRNVAGY